MRKVILIAVFISLCYCLYATVGYAMIGFSSPVVVGKVNGYFVGNFLWSIVYLILTICLAIMFLIIYKRKGKKR